MSRLKRVAQVGTLGLTIAALGAGAIVGKRYAEQRLLANIVGEGTTARGISLHWTRSTGCVEAFETPLPGSRDAHENPLSLYADKLWFVFDNAQLLRKRLVMPRIVAEGVLISANVDSMLEPDVLNVDFDMDASISMPAIDAESKTELIAESNVELHAGFNSAVNADEQSHKTGSAGSTDAQLSHAQLPVSTAVLQHPATSQPASHEWIARLAAIHDELTSDRFAKSRQVAVDADMLAERMQAHFENVRQQALRAVNEVRDIQLQIQSLDNVLRHELKIMAQRERIEQLKSGLIGLKSEVARSDKALSDELSRLRAALLIEKESLLTSSKEFRAPVAKDLASETIHQMITQALREPARQAILLRDLMQKPFDPSGPTRGRDVRYAAGQLSTTEVESAKLSGELEWDGQRQPFTASGSFKIPAANAFTTAQPCLVPDTVRWQMQIGNGSAATQLRGHSMTTIGPNGGCPTTIVDIEDLEHWQAFQFEFRSDEMRGQGTVSLRPWIVMQAEASSDRSPAGFTTTTISNANNQAMDECVDQWMSYALSNVEEAPESLRFHFALVRRGNSDSLASFHNDDVELMVTESSSDWLGERIASAATTELAGLTVTAADKLEAYITQRIVDLQRSVAMMRNDADQNLNHQIDELKKIQAAINSSLQQRAGTHFARLRSEEIVR